MTDSKESHIFLTPVPSSEGMTDTYYIRIEGIKKRTEEKAWLGLTALMSVQYEPTPVGQDEFFDFTNQLLTGTTPSAQKGHSPDKSITPRHIGALHKALDTNKTEPGSVTQKRLQRFTNQYQHGHTTAAVLMTKLKEEEAALNETRNIIIIDKDGRSIKDHDKEQGPIPLTRTPDTTDLPTAHLADDLGYLHDNPPMVVNDIHRLKFIGKDICTIVAHQTYGHIDQDGAFQPVVTVLGNAATTKATPGAETL